MPKEFHNSENQIRNCLVTLHEFRSVDIHWEIYPDATSRDGESVGEWFVEIETRCKTVTAKHGTLTNALWYAVTLARNCESEEYANREMEKSLALAKLTYAERELLGI